MKAFRSGIHSSSAGRTGRADHKRLPQLKEVKQIHAHIMESGNEFQTLEIKRLMDMYVKCGSMVDACYLFDNMPNRDVVSWNVMILGYAKTEEGALALEFFERMHLADIRPSDRTFVGALKACSSLVTTLEDGKQVDGKLVKLMCLEKVRAIHSEVVQTRFESNIYVGTTLVDVYSNLGSMEDAWLVFDELPYHDVVSWNAMILGYSKKEDGGLALKLYAQMQQEGVIPDHRTFVAALKACSSLAALEEGKQVYQAADERKWLEKGKAINSQILKSGFDSNVFVGTTLVDMYLKCGSMEDARRVFDKLSHRNVVSWNAMISGYAEKEEGARALELYAQMYQECVQPSDGTFVGALKACSSLAKLEDGKQVVGKSVNIGGLEKGRAVHFQIVKSGFESHAVVGTTLVDMYAKCWSTEDARDVFDKLPHQSVASWTTMILGYAELEESEEAFKLYTEMQDQGVTANSITFVSILKACGNTAALEIGKALHGQICRLGLETTVMVRNSLIDMYAKCGSMIDAQQLFDALLTRDVVSWTGLIAGYANWGESDLVFDLFDRMTQESIQPNWVTFLTVLTVCSHAGLVDQAQKYFQVMTTQYNIVPTVEHYNCMVDLLGRAGLLNEAVLLVEKMPFHCNLVGWMTVLGACRKWKNVELGRYAFENMVRLDERHPAAYVLMSNLYADAHMWEDLNKLHVMRKNAKACWKPEHSWWTDNEMVHTFVVGGRTHPQSIDILIK